MDVVCLSGLTCSPWLLQSQLICTSDFAQPTATCFRGLPPRWMEHFSCLLLSPRGRFLLPLWAFFLVIPESADLQLF